jgi:hypothetical protein
VDELELFCGRVIGSGALADQAAAQARTEASSDQTQPLAAQDDAWLLEHLAVCVGCEMVHAAMLEASVCCRAWS